MNEINQKLNTIGKAISIIEAIRSANHSLSIKEIAGAVGLNKSSLHHHIKTLTEFGYLQQDGESRKYDIGLNLVRVGQSYIQRVDVRLRGHNYLEQLSKLLSNTEHMLKTVHLLILDHDEAVYVDKVDVKPQPGSLMYSSYIGLRTDVYSTAAGKVLIASLEREALNRILLNIELRPITAHTITQKSELKEELQLVKERGYALDLQEHSVGLQCIAVPVLDLHSQCIAAISVSCPVSSISTAALEAEVLGHIKDTSLKISEAMEYMPTA